MGSAAGPARAVVPLAGSGAPVVERISLGEHVWIEFARAPVPTALRSLVAGRCGFREQAPPALVRPQPASTLTIVVIEYAGAGPGPFVAGMRSGLTTSQGTGPTAGVQVYLTPSGVGRILGIPGGELADRVVALGDLRPGLAADLPERLAAASTWAERLRLVDRWLLRAAYAGPEPDPGIERAWRALASADGALRVDDLVLGSGLSHRHFLARFRAEVGLPPKLAAQVLRFEQATRRLAHGPSLAGVAHGAGFADQSHLTRAFRRFSGTTPSGWLRSPLPTPAGAYAGDAQRVL